MFSGSLANVSALDHAIGVVCDTSIRIAKTLIMNGAGTARIGAVSTNGTGVVSPTGDGMSVTEVASGIVTGGAAAIEEKATIGGGIGREGITGIGKNIIPGGLYTLVCDITL